MKKLETLSLQDKLMNKIYAYYQTIWREKWKEGIEKEWLANFKIGDEDLINKEKINMLYLLSKFMYFGNDELRHLLFCLFRDLYKYPIIAKIRKNNGDTTENSFICKQFNIELSKTRFLGVGNPSESGVHMLYYFRQESKLSKEFFINASDIFTTSKITEKLPNESCRTYLKSEIKNKEITRYIFIDDFCGSGSQVSLYLNDIVENMRFENPSLEINYLMLFGTEYGINQVRNANIFSSVEAVFSIDDTFKAFSDNSRYYKTIPDLLIEKIFSKVAALKYGTSISPTPLGYKDGQLLLALFHNTPDNSLPIFWSEHDNWKPIFKRYNKIY